MCLSNPDWENVEGILLNPAVNQPINATFDPLRLPVFIVTNNLNTPWQDNESELEVLSLPVV